MRAIANFALIWLSVLAAGCETSVKEQFKPFQADRRTAADTVNMTRPKLGSDNLYRWFTTSGCLYHWEQVRTEPSTGVPQNEWYRTEWNGTCKDGLVQGIGVLRRYLFTTNYLLFIEQGTFNNGDLENGVRWVPDRRSTSEYSIQRLTVTGGKTTSTALVSRDSAPVELVRSYEAAWKGITYFDPVQRQADNKRIQESNAQAQRDVNKFFGAILGGVNEIAQAKSDQYRNQTDQIKIRAEKDAKVRERMQAEVATRNKNEKSERELLKEAGTQSENLRTALKTRGKEVPDFGSCYMSFAVVDKRPEPTNQARAEKRIDEDAQYTDFGPIKWLCEYPGVSGNCFAFRGQAKCEVHTELIKGKVVRYFDEFRSEKPGAESVTQGFICPAGSLPLEPYARMGEKLWHVETGQCMWK